MDIRREPIESQRPARSARGLRAVAGFGLLVIALVAVQVVDRDPSPSAKIKTVNQYRPEVAAIENVGGENLAASPLLVETTSSSTSTSTSTSTTAALAATTAATATTTTTVTTTTTTSTGAGADPPTSEPEAVAPAGQSLTPESSVPASTTTTSPSTVAPDPTAPNPTSTSVTSTTSTTSTPSAPEPSGPASTAAPRPVDPGGTNPATIPFVSGGVGDGPSGGRAPWTPPPAPVPVDDPGDAEVTTVAAGCTAANDCGAEIKRILNTTDARPLRVTFGDPGLRGARFNLDSPIIAQSGVTIEGINQPTLVVTAGSVLFNVSGTSNVSIRNFDLDMQRCGGGSNAVVAAASPVENLYVSGIAVANAIPTDGQFCPSDFVRIGASATASNINIYNNDVVRLHRLVRIQANASDIAVLNNVVREIGREGYIQTGQGTSRNVRIEGNVFSRHAPNVATGHMIGFPLSTVAEPRTYARNVVVRNNLVEGRPNVPHVRTAEGTLANGGAGDLIAMRGVDGFVVEGNMVRHSGEVGITATAGLKNGVIRYNQVSYTDTTGIVVGNVGRNINEGVQNVDVYRNELFQNSLDRHREFTDRDHPAFSLWNTVDSCIVNNYIHHNWNSNGFWVWNGNTATWPASVFDVFIDGNRFEANKRDFVEAPGQTPPYAAASPRGGENWTSFYDTAVDRDNDGLPGRCSSERDDNDPCVPDRFAEACRG